MDEISQQPSAIVTLPPVVTPDALKIALLENNLVLNKSITENGEKVSKVVNDQMGTFIESVKGVTADQTRLELKFDNFKTWVEGKLQGIWGKVAIIAVVCSLISAIIGYFIGAGHFLAK